jgi:dienelactone hydrolase
LSDPISRNVVTHSRLVKHSDWDGNNVYEQERATLLAELGFVGFAADIYGADLQSNLTIDERRELTGLYRGKRTLFVQRIERALEQIKTFDFVDVNNIAVIGYCFGGTGIIQLAFSGNDEVQVVVSFHGGLTNLTDPVTTITPYTLM